MTQQNAFEKFEQEDKATKHELISKLTKALLDYARFTQPTKATLKEVTGAIVDQVAELLPRYFED